MFAFLLEACYIARVDSGLERVAEWAVPCLDRDPGPSLRLEGVKAAANTADVVFARLTDVDRPETLSEIAKAWQVPVGRFVQWFTTEHEALYDAALKVLAAQDAVDVVRIADEAAPESVQVAEDWQPRLGATGLGAAVGEAYLGAVQQRMTSWVTQLDEDGWRSRVDQLDPATQHRPAGPGGVPRAPGSSPLTGGAPLTGAAPRPLGDLVREFERVADGIGESTHPRVAATGPSGGGRLPGSLDPCAQPRLVARGRVAVNHAGRGGLVELPAGQAEFDVDLPLVAAGDRGQHALDLGTDRRLDGPVSRAALQALAQPLLRLPLASMAFDVAARATSRCAADVRERPSNRMQSLDTALRSLEARRARARRAPPARRPAI